MSDFLTQLRVLMKRITDRFDAVLQQTETEASKLLADSPPNHQAVQRALDAVGMRLDGLKDKLYDGWRQHADTIGGDEARHHAHMELKTGIRKMHDAAQRQRVRLDAATAQAMWPLVLDALNAAVQCRECGARLERGDPLAMVTATCPFCRAVTQFVPDPILKIFYPKMAEQLALCRHIEQAVAIKVHYRTHHDWADREKELNGVRPAAPPETVAKIRLLEQAYFQNYLDALSRLMPLSEDKRREAMDRYIGERVERILSTEVLM
jgi:hypothetical protein